MEEKNMQVNEIDIAEEESNVIEEASDGFDAGAMFAGFAGGFLAYAAISGVKKLVAFGQTQLAKFKQTKADKENNVIEAECEVVEETAKNQTQEENSDM